jgi:GntR family transcriptional regulator
MKKIKRRSLSSQARDEILELILNDEYKFMDQLPSEQDLADQLGVSRNTIREAIRLLESDGYVIARHGVGTFVIRNMDSIRTNIANLESSTKIIATHGYCPGTKSIITSVFSACGFVARELGLSEDDNIFYIERVRTADGKAVVYVEDYIPYIEGMERKYLEDRRESLLEFLQSFDHTISFSVCRISAVISDDKIAEKLELSQPTALLKLTQTHYNSFGHPALFSNSFYDSNMFEFSVIRKTS